MLNTQTKKTQNRETRSGNLSTNVEGTIDKKEKALKHIGWKQHLPLTGQHINDNQPGKQTSLQNSMPRVSPNLHL